MSIISVSAINNNIVDMAEVAGAQQPEPSEGSHDTNGNRTAAPLFTPAPPRTRAPPLTPASPRTPAPPRASAHPLAPSLPRRHTLAVSPRTPAPAPRTSGPPLAQAPSLTSAALPLAPALPRTPAPPQPLAQAPPPLPLPGNNVMNTSRRGRPPKNGWEVREVKVIFFNIIYGSTILSSCILVEILAP